jgi:hypothetical protein
MIMKAIYLTSGVLVRMVDCVPVAGWLPGWRVTPDALEELVFGRGYKAQRGEITAEQQDLRVPADQSPVPMEYLKWEFFSGTG